MVIRRLLVRNLTLRRGGRRIFAAADFSLEAGEALQILGVNGAGKTSLLRAVAGLLVPETGGVVFEGEGGPLDPEAARSEGLHLLGHMDGLKTQRSALEELRFWSRWSGSGSAGLDRAVAVFGLGPLLGLDVHALSAGQRRRLALARLVASPRPLWLLDEPLAPLDHGARGVFGQVMAEHLAGGGLVAAAVHDPLPGAARSLALGG